MPVMRISVILRCTRENVFDHLYDHRSELEWNPKCERMEKLTDDSVGAGTRYGAKWRAARSSAASREETANVGHLCDAVENGSRPAPLPNNWCSSGSAARARHRGDGSASAPRAQPT